MADGKLTVSNEDFTEDSAEFMLRGNWFNITVNNPWAGSTEEGFGIHSTISLKRADAEAIYNWLRDALEIP